MKRIKMISLIILLLLTIMFLSGYMVERIIRWAAESRMEPIGEFADVNGHLINYIKMGNGTPTIIFETGHATTGHIDWLKLQEMTSEITTSLSYSRSGLLWSERGESPKTSESMGEELEMLLELSACTAPYIVVAHSFGGVTIRNFIHENRDDIAGIVLLDTLNPRLYEEANHRQLQLDPLPPRWVMGLSGEIGLARLMLRYVYPGTEENDPVNVITNSLVHRGLETNIEEIYATRTISEEVCSLDDFGDIPLVVVAGSHYESMGNQEMAELFMDMQKDLLDLSTDSEFIVAEESGHMIHWEQTDLVYSIIASMIEDSDAPSSTN